MADAGPAAGLSREALEAVIERSPYARGLGVQLAACAPGEVEVRLPVQPRFAQHHGFVHGSLVGFMADTACAWAAASVAGDVVTAECKLNLLAPALGDALVARGTVVKAGTRQVVARFDRTATDAPVTIQSAAVVTAGAPAPYCAVQGTIAPANTFVMRLTTQGWTQRYLQTGCGGLCGTVTINYTAAGTCPPVADGTIANAATDMGHQGQPGRERQFHPAGRQAALDP